MTAILLTIVLPQSVKAYDFSAVAPSGQTLYYNISGSNMSVTSQNSSYPYYSTFPTGNLEIPSSVTYNGTTYSVTEIGNSAFYECSGLTSVTIPNSVTSIEINAFLNCSGLTSVDIPNSVTSIGHFAFQNCSRLPSVTIPSSVTSIGIGAFSGCSGLTSMIIGDSVITIGDNAFQNCSGLTSVTIPNSVISIGNYAFSICSGLTSVTIPSSVISIGACAFAICSGLTSITVESGNIVYDSRDNCNAIIKTSTNTLIAGCMNTVVPNSVTTIDNFAFYGCSSLASVTIGDSVTTIGNYAFSGCSGLTEITCLASTAPTLGTNVFEDVSSTIPVNIPCGGTASYQSAWSYFSNFNEIFPYVFDVQSDDEAMGTVSILTQPICEAPNAEVNATAKDGYRFDHWSDGTIDNPYSLAVTQDTALVAYFVTTEGIGDVDGTDAKVTVVDGQIVVENANGNTVTLYDIMGRQITPSTAGVPTACQFDIPTSGVYLVKIGNHTARKVVVIR